MSASGEAFIRAHTALAAPPLLPDLRLYLATEITPIWHATETWLAAEGIAPPYWAFAWAGGQALARYVTDHPEIVAGEAVLDFGCGGGLIAIAASLAGAESVVAVDIDPLAAMAVRMNAAANGAAIQVLTDDVIGQEVAARVILVGDMCYERPLAERLILWLRGLAASGALVLIGDPGRTYLPEYGMERLTSYLVPTSLELEDRIERETVVWRLLAG